MRSKSAEVTRTAPLFDRQAKTTGRAAVGMSGQRLADRGPLAISWYEDLLSFSYPFCIMLLILFNPQISPAGPALQILLTVLVSAFMLRTRPRDLASQWPILTVGVVCAGSAIWSVAPDLTIRNGVEVFITLATGALLGMMINLRRVIAGFFFAFLIYVIVSVAIGNTVAIGNQGGEALAGLNSSKNFFASSVIILCISAAAYAVSNTRYRAIGFALVAFAAALSVFSLAKAHSATAIISAAAGVGVFGICYFASALPLRQRMMIIGAAFVSLVPLTLVAADIEEVVVGGTLASFGKNAGLTGRAALGKSADRLIKTRPLLGRGYYTFWVKGNPPAEDLWSRNFIKSRYGFNFHNSPREIRIAVGWVGFAVIAAILVIEFAILGGLAVIRPSLSIAFWSATGGSVLLRFWTESIFPVPFALETVLLAGAMAAGQVAFLKLRRRPRTQANRVRQGWQ